MEHRALKQYLEAGEFVTTHGVEGELRLYPWSDDPACLAGITTLYTGPHGGGRLDGVQIRPHKSVCIVRLPGVVSVEAARPYIGTVAYVSRADYPLPAGHHFIQDLIGCRVVDARSGEEYGVIGAVTRPGRHDVYEVVLPGGGTVLFPAVEAFISHSNPAAGIITINPIEGMFNSETLPNDERTPPADDSN